MRNLPFNTIDLEPIFRNEISKKRKDCPNCINQFFLKNDSKSINIGSAGGMTRLSTGYTFLNIQEHSKYIVKNIDDIDKIKKFNIGKKYQFLDKVFLRVLKKHPEKMPKIFFNMFKTSSNTIIKFLSNKSNMIEDIIIISKMPKLIFLKALFN